MKEPAAQVLVVSPDEVVLRFAQHCLLPLRCAPVIARSLRQAQRTLTRTRVDLVCLDSLIPAHELERFWRWLRASQLQALPCLVVFAPPSAKLAPAAFLSFYQPERDGLVSKPLEGSELAREVTRLLAEGPRRDRGEDLLRVGS